MLKTVKPFLTWVSFVCRRPGAGLRLAACAGLAAALPAMEAAAGYTNFESSHVHPVALTPDGGTLLAINTPDATLEVFTVEPDGGLTPTASVPVGLEPVSVRARGNDEAWVVNHLSDSVSIIDLTAGLSIETLPTGDEPTDVVFAGGRAFVAVSQLDRVEVFDLANLAAAPAVVPIFSRDVRALAVAGGGSQVAGVSLRSGNRTTVVNALIAFGNDGGHDDARLAELGLNPTECAGDPPPYPPLPDGVVRNPELTDPPYFPDPNDPMTLLPGVPPVGLVVRWDGAAGQWRDETGADWSHCLPYRLPDHDLFLIDTATLAVSYVDHLGTSLLEVSVNPASGAIYVPHTEARNDVRFEHPEGVQGHVVDNRLAIVDPGNGFAVTTLDLNAHIDRTSDPAANLAERQASVSQPGMMAWDADGTRAFLTAIGSRKLFVVDGACLAGSCIFGPDRSAPRAVEVGEGPTGVAFLETGTVERAYVLNRFSNSLAVVDTATLTKVAEIPLHDPSPEEVKNGRRHLYDAVSSSAHGDAACSSCHISGDLDDLAWDLGDPSGTAQLYADPNDNVRFIVPQGGVPTECPADLCAAHAGFDPQKGPMTTQTLRGMLEPLHWRGDRADFTKFNKAFVGLLGAADVGPVQGEPAGLSAAEMSTYRQFALGIHYPPNPYRDIFDRLPDASMTLPGMPFPGNPRQGETEFLTAASDAGQPCTSCHALPFGAAGGQTGGVTPAEPTSPEAAALFNGTPDGSPHSDLKVPHLRNMHEKFGPLFGDHVGAPPEAKSGFGYTHDGSIPDLGTFFSFSVFTVTAQQVRDITAFMFAFPSGVKPAVGSHVTVPAGGSGSAEDEATLAALILGHEGGVPARDRDGAVIGPLGDLSTGARHCELTATTRQGGRRRSYLLDGGSWRPDVAAEAPVTTADLRADAEGFISFLCAPVGSGARLGGDRDEDGILDGDDCAAADPGSWSPVAVVTDLAVGSAAPTPLSWSEQATAAGPGTRYEVVSGRFSELADPGLAAAGCRAGDLSDPAHTDDRPEPPAGDGYYYLARAFNACGGGSWGAGRPALDGLTCP